MQTTRISVFTLVLLRLLKYWSSMNHASPCTCPLTMWHCCLSFQEGGDHFSTLLSGNWLCDLLWLRECYGCCPILESHSSALSLSLNPKTTIYEEAQFSLLGNNRPCREPRQHLAPSANQPHEWFLAGPADKLSSCAQPDVLIYGLTRTIRLVLF